jgi:hypothetical protein
VKYSLLLITTAVVALGCPQPARADCTFRYDTKLAEAAGDAKLGLAVRSAQNVVNQVESALGASNTPQKFSLKGSYSISAAGGLAESAYTETARAFFACAREKMAADPAKTKILDTAEKDLVLTLNSFFDVGRWQPENIDARDALRKQLADAPSIAPLFSTAEINKVLPSPAFDTVKIVSLMGDAKIPGVDLGACGGLVFRSLKKVDPSILDALGTVRATVLAFLSGDQSGAKLDLWLFASTQMSKQIASSQTTEQVTATPALLTCVQSQAKAAQDAAAAVANGKTTPPVTPSA